MINYSNIIYIYRYYLHIVSGNNLVTVDVERVIFPICFVSGRTAPSSKLVLPRHRCLHAVLLSCQARLLYFRLHALGRRTESSECRRRPRRHPGRSATQPGGLAPVDDAGTDSRVFGRCCFLSRTAKRTLHWDVGEDLCSVEGSLRFGHHRRSEEAKEKEETVEEVVLRVRIDSAVFVLRMTRVEFKVNAQVLVCSMLGFDWKWWLNWIPAKFQAVV